MANELGPAIRDEILQLLGPLARAGSGPGGTATLLRAVGHVGAIGSDPGLVAGVQRLARTADGIAALDDETLRSWEGVVRVLGIARELSGAVRSVGSELADPALAQRAHS